MLKKSLIISTLFLLVLVVSGCAQTSANKNTNTVSAVDIVTGAADVKIKQQADKDLAVAKAKELWRIQFQMETDLSAGPCLSNSVIPDWVADIAHNPRQAVDDQLENQCSAYRDGTAHHFVELDPEGNLIRTQ
jgi:hypothetical protein